MLVIFFLFVLNYIKRLKVENSFGNFTNSDAESQETEAIFTWTTFIFIIGKTRIVQKLLHIMANVR